MNTPLFVPTVFIQSFPFLGKENAQIINPLPPTPQNKHTNKQFTTKNSLIRDRICTS